MEKSASRRQKLFLRSTHAARWLMLVAASVLLHWTVFQWAGGHILFPSYHEEQADVITTQLYAPPPPPAPPKPKPRKKPIAPPAAAIKPIATPVKKESNVAVPAAVLPAPAADAIATALDEAGYVPPQPEASDSTEDMTEAPETSDYTFSLPPPAELTYDVTALHEQQNWYGTGVFRWDVNGSHYSVTGEASVRIIFKIDLLNFKSEGVINDFGIAPQQYSEQARRKPLMTTQFRKDEGKIQFSASSATYPYHGGEQDRASVIWQLAALGRGDPAQFAPGTDFDIVVAGTRNADTWHLSVVGQEQIETGYGSFLAWHVVRLPQAGSHEQRIDIWFANQQEWYPVKVRYTEADGAHLDMSLSDLKPVTTTTSPTENP